MSAIYSKTVAGEHVNIDSGMSMKWSPFIPPSYLSFIV